MIIENDEEHRLALAAYEAVLTLNGGDLGDDDQKWIDVVIRAIEVYELAHFQIADPTPEEARAFRDSQETHRFESDGGDVCIKCQENCGGRVHGHVPIDKMSAVVCDRCGLVLLRER